MNQPFRIENYDSSPSKLQLDSLHFEISRLRGELLLKDKQIEQLLHALRPMVIVWPRRWQLSPRQSEVLTAIYQGNVRYDKLFAIVYAGQPLPRNPRIILATQITHMRNKLPHGIMIKPIYRVGYSMTDADRELLQPYAEGKYHD